MYASLIFMLHSETLKSYEDYLTTFVFDSLIMD